MKSDRIDVHQKVTDQIVALIEAGAGAFNMPWHRSNAPLHRPINALTGKHYRGINIVSLWGAAEVCGYSSNVWGTYKQFQEIDAQVRKGERSSLVVVYKEFSVEPDEDNERDDGRRMFARASCVFNAAQVDGYTADTAPDLGPIERRENADRFIAATGAKFKYGGERAFYRPSEDTITMPSEGLFLGDQVTRSEAYYATAFHELTHWTGAEKRLNRELGKRFGNNAYAMEELIAELGAAFLCSALTITNTPRTDHAQYLQHWLTILKADKRAIFTAAAKAGAAAEYLEQITRPQQQQQAA